MGRAREVGEGRVERRKGTGNNDFMTRVVE
jgi:hypothetical protein